MQRMAGDKALPQAQTAVMRLLEAISDASDETGVNKAAIARELGFDPSQSTRLFQGQFKDLGVFRLLALDKAFGFPPGTLLCRAALIEPPKTFEDYLDASPLAADVRAAMRTLYRHAVIEGRDGS